MLIFSMRLCQKYCLDRLKQQSTPANSLQASEMAASKLQAVIQNSRGGLNKSSLPVKGYPSALYLQIFSPLIVWLAQAPTHTT